MSTVTEQKQGSLKFDKLDDPTLRAEAILAAKIMTVVDYHYRLRSQSEDGSYPYTIREMMKVICSDCGGLITSYACLNGIQAKNILVGCIRSFTDSSDYPEQAQKEIETIIREAASECSKHFPASGK